MVAGNGVPWQLHFEIDFAGPGCGKKLILKTFVTILSFTFFGKTGNFAVLICYAYQYQQASAFQRKNKTHFTLNLVQN